MTLTMRRNYGLVLPKNYVSIDQNEMEYIDGGGLFGAISFGVLGFGIGLATAPFKSMAMNKIYEKATGKKKELTFGQIMKSAGANAGKAALAGALSPI